MGGSPPESGRGHSATCHSASAWALGGQDAASIIGLFPKWGPRAPQWGWQGPPEPCGPLPLLPVLMGPGQAHPLLLCRLRGPDGGCWQHSGLGPRPWKARVALVNPSDKLWWPHLCQRGGLPGGGFIYAFVSQFTRQGISRFADKFALLGSGGNVSRALFQERKRRMKTEQVVFPSLPGSAGAVAAVQEGQALGS